MKILRWLYKGIAYAIVATVLIGSGRWNPDSDLLGIRPLGGSTPHTESLGAVKPLFSGWNSCMGHRGLFVMENSGLKIIIYFLRGKAYKGRRTNGVAVLGALRRRERYED